LCDVSKNKKRAQHHQLKASETAKSFDVRTAKASVPECLRILSLSFKSFISQCQGVSAKKAAQQQCLHVPVKISSSL
jgi:hypothetical protein